jgi:hypothetical protein
VLAYMAEGFLVADDVFVLIALPNDRAEGAATPDR